MLWRRKKVEVIVPAAEPVEAPTPAPPPPPRPLFLTVTDGDRVVLSLPMGVLLRGLPPEIKDYCRAELSRGA